MELRRVRVLTRRCSRFCVVRPPLEAGENRQQRQQSNPKCLVKFVGGCFPVFPEVVRYRFLPFGRESAEGHTRGNESTITKPSYDNCRSRSGTKWLRTIAEPKREWYYRAAGTARGSKRQRHPDGVAPVLGDGEAEVVVQLPDGRSQTRGVFAILLPGAKSRGRFPESSGVSARSLVPTLSPLSK